MQRGMAELAPDREMLFRERNCLLWKFSSEDSTSVSLSRLDTSCTSSASSHPLSKSSNASSSMPRSAPHPNLPAAHSLNSYSQASVQKQSQSPLIPHPEAVTNLSVLQNLAVVYAGCIRGNLVPNVLLEVYLVLHLLSVHSIRITHFKPSQGAGRPDELSRSYLNSVHNCVSFAVCVLAELTRFLTLLDHGTLRLLSESKLIESFSPHLHSQLAAALPQALKQTPCCPRTANSSLPFQLETDNRATFATNRTFQTFKKQRDQLFILIREWEDNHTKPSWDFEQNMGLRVRTMMLQLTHVDAHSHFSRFFLAQLLRVCKHGYVDKAGSREHALSNDRGRKGTKGEHHGGTSYSQACPLSSLGMDNPGKLWHLQKRLTTPSAPGPNAPPTFSDHQIFFHDFLISASSWQLSQHLCDRLKEQLLKLDGMCFANDDDGLGVENDGHGRASQQKFAAVLLSARLLAKFLGLLTFLPYQKPKLSNPSPVPRLKLQHEFGEWEKVSSPVCNQASPHPSAWKKLCCWPGWFLFLAVYSRCLERILEKICNISGCTFKKNRKLILLLSLSLCLRDWCKCIQFMTGCRTQERSAMLDVHAIMCKAAAQQRLVLTLPWITQFLAMADPTAYRLPCYYPAICSLLHIYRTVTLESDLLCEVNNLFVIATLGWLFQLPGFPTDLVFSNFATENVPQVDGKREDGQDFLDTLPMVDQDLLHSCCPYFAEMRRVLTLGQVGVVGGIMRVGGPLRKITPTAADASSVCKSHFGQRDTQEMLQEAFFHNHPPSLRRTVEFVVERVASNCSANICSVELRHLVKKTEPDLRSRVKVHGVSEQYEEELGDFVLTTTSELASQVRPLALHKINRFCHDKALQAVQLLLPNASLQVTAIAGQIAASMAVRKASTFLQDNLTNFLKKEIEASIEWISKQDATMTTCLDLAKGSMCPFGCEHSAPRPSRIIHSLKDFLCCATGSQLASDEPSFKVARSIVVDMTRAIGCRKFLLPRVERTLMHLSVELAALLVLRTDVDWHGSNSDRKALLYDLEVLWRNCIHSPPFYLLLAPRTIAVSLKGSKGRINLQELVDLLVHLINQGLLDPKDTIGGWEKLFVEHWPSQVLRDLEAAAGQFRLLCRMTQPSVLPQDPLEDISNASLIPTTENLCLN
uniref:Codanin 1 n=1 Tax=Eptatretus burgeri TaxID=7764 RepID=A0A8C4X0B7_EPTBU